MRAYARRPLDPTCASSSYQTRGGACRIPVLDPTLYEGTASGRERGEENEFKQKRRKPPAGPREVFNLNMRLSMQGVFTEQQALTDNQ